MLGIRSVGLLGRALCRPASTLSLPSASLYLPKVQFSLMNKQSTSLQMRAGLSLLSGNLVVRNLLQVLEKMNEEVDQDSDKDVKNLTLLSQGTLRMSHQAVCLQ